MEIMRLGEPCYPSPVKRTVRDDLFVPEHIIQKGVSGCEDAARFELAGPRLKLFFDPRETRAGIVTCGGLCPGLNVVIRSLFMELHHAYGVKAVLGFRGGYGGLDPQTGDEPLLLSPDFVNDIHKSGGTVLGTSRGPVDTVAAVDNLIRRNINLLFTIGGDGTQRGAKDLFHEAERRGYKLAVVGIPKTIDNDVPYVSRTFGYLTAVEEAAKIIDRAHTEARSVRNGISLVKLMGRHAGFIAAGATVSSQDVNFTLVPEIPFALEGPQGFLAVLKERILRRQHAVIVVAEGAGQELMPQDALARDASGNVNLADIGPFLCARIKRYFAAEAVPAVLRYFDPSYLIRSSPADSEDTILCDLFARHAAHAAMAGKTGLVIGCLNDHFIHVPMDLVTSQRKTMDTHGPNWASVLAATGQPERFG